MKRKQFILLLLMLPIAAQGQYVSLYAGRKGLRLDLDADRGWTYNLYEHSRWGAGLRLTLPPSKTNGDVVALSAHAGYGMHDKQWKYGLGASVRLGRSDHDALISASVGRDYHAAANRRLHGSGISDLAGMSTLMTRRMSERTGATVAYGWRTDSTRHTLAASLFAGGRLFGGNGLLYRTAGDAIDEEDGATLQWHAAHSSGIEARLTLGASWPQQKTVVQLLAQYTKQVPAGPFTLHLYAQTGLTPANTPYTYMFDLGGTYGAPLYFSATLLTAAPNEFTANAFFLVTPRLVLTRPLYRLWDDVVQLGSAPRPFAGLAACWGSLWGSRADGSMNYEGLDLQAPQLGIAEAVAGVESLVRWGVIDLGAALAYRFAPPSATYHHAQPWLNLAVMLTATANLDF